jgi:hypothetical protein
MIQINVLAVKGVLNNVTTSLKHYYYYSFKIQISVYNKFVHQLQFQTIIYYPHKSKSANNNSY